MSRTLLVFLHWSSFSFSFVTIQIILPLFSSLLLISYFPHSSPLFLPVPLSSRLPSSLSYLLLLLLLFSLQFSLPLSSPLLPSQSKMINIRLREEKEEKDLAEISKSLNRDTQARAQNTPTMEQLLLDPLSPIYDSEISRVFRALPINVMKAQLSPSPPVYPPLPPDLLARVPYNDQHLYQKATPTSTSGPSNNDNEQEGNRKLKKGFEEIDDFHSSLQNIHEEYEHRMLLHDHFKDMIELLKDKEHSQERSFKTYFRTQGALISLLEHAEICFNKAICFLEVDGERYYPDTHRIFDTNVRNNSDSDNYNENNRKYRSEDEMKEDQCRMITMELNLIAVCAQNDTAVKTKLIERNIIKTLIQFLFELEKRHRPPLCSDSDSDVVKGSVSVELYQKAKTTSTSTSISSEFQEYQMKKYDLFIYLVSSVVQVIEVCCEEDCYDTLLLITRNNSVLPALYGIVKNVLYRKCSDLTALNKDVCEGVRTGVHASDAHSIARLRLITGAASILKSMTFKCQSKYYALVRTYSLVYVCGYCVSFLQQYHKIPFFSIEVTDNFLSHNLCHFKN